MLLTRSWSKSRLLATCFSVFPAKIHSDAIKNFQFAVYKGRWGSVIEAAAAVWDIKDILRSAWGLRKYNFGGGQNQDRDADEFRSLKLEVANEAIISDKFWAYCCMIVHASEVLQNIALWSESCPCHDDLVVRAHDSASRQRAFKEKIGRPTCPMSTRRAPELACGALSVFMDTLFARNDADLLLQDVVRQAPNRVRTIVNSDFEKFRRHVLLTIDIKMAFWSQLPWILFGVAHHDVELARRAGERAIVLFDADNAGEFGAYHWLSLTACAPGSVGRGQLAQFCQGTASLSELPFLHQLASKLRFAMVSERWVEGRHALIKKTLAPCNHAGAVHIAYSGLIPSIRKMISDDPNALSTLATCARSTRNPGLAAKAVGMWHHPVVQEALRVSGGRHSDLHHKQRPEVVKAIFHVDDPTLFRSLPDSLNMPPPPPLPPSDAPPAGGAEEDARQADDDIGPGGIEPRVERDVHESGGSLHDQLWRQHMLQRVRDVTDEVGQEGGEQRDLIFSIGRRDDPFPPRALPKLLELLTPKQAVLSRDDDDLFDFVPERPPSTSENSKENVSGHYFFSIVCQNPGDKVVSLRQATVQRKSMAVSQLHVVHSTPGANGYCLMKMDMSSRSEAEALILTSSSFELPCANSCAFWKVDPSTFYTFQGFGLQGIDVDILQKLVNPLLACFDTDEKRRKPYVLTSHHATAATQDVLAKLCASGIVEELPKSSHNATEWSLTLSGFFRIESLRRISDPCALVEPRSSVAKRDLSTLELHTLLLRAGWTCRVKESRGERPKPYKVGSPKVWWLRQKQEKFQRLYFDVLLEAETHKQEVAHCQPDAYYEALAEGREYKKNSRKRDAVFDFFGENTEAPPQKRRAIPKRDSKTLPRKKPPAKKPRKVEGEPLVEPPSSSEGSGSSGSSSSSTSSNNIPDEEPPVAAAAVSPSGIAVSDAPSVAAAVLSEEVIDVVVDLPDVSGPEALVEALPAVLPAPKRRGRAKAKESSRAPRGSGGDRMFGYALGTDFWGAYKFTPVKDATGLEVVGMEAQCYRECHKDRLRCTKQMSYSVHGGEEMTLRKLKLWCLCGELCDTRIHHRDVKLPKIIPEDAELNASLDAQIDRSVSGAAGSGLVR